MQPVSQIECATLTLKISSWDKKRKSLKGFMNTAFGNKLLLDTSRKFWLSKKQYNDVVFIGSTRTLPLKSAINAVGGFFVCFWFCFCFVVVSWRYQTPESRLLNYLIKRVAIIMCQVPCLFAARNMGVCVLLLTQRVLFMLDRRQLCVHIFLARLPCGWSQVSSKQAAFKQRFSVLIFSLGKFHL